MLKPVNSRSSLFSLNHLLLPLLQRQTQYVTGQLWYEGNIKCQGSVLLMLISAHASHPPRNCPLLHKFSHRNSTSGQAPLFLFSPVCSQCLEHLTGSDVKGCGLSNAYESVLTLAVGSTFIIVVADAAIPLTSSNVSLTLKFRLVPVSVDFYRLHFLTSISSKKFTLRGCEGWQNVHFKCFQSVSVHERMFNVQIQTQQAPIFYPPYNDFTLQFEDMTFWQFF